MSYRTSNFRAVATGEMHHRPPAWLRWAIRIVSATGFLVTAFLLASSLLGGGVAGCGSDGLFDCNEVLQSPWAWWLGFPVSAPAASVYLTLLVASLFVGPRAPSRVAHVAWSLILTLSVVVGGSALWFLGLQAVVIQSICVFCVAVHLCGLLISILCLATHHRAVPTGLGLIGILVLVIGQLAVKPPKTSRLERIANAGTDAPLFIGSLDEISHASTKNGKPVFESNAHHTDPGTQPNRLISVLDGNAKLDPRATPILGSPDADCVLVELFDYTCPACRKLHVHLSAARERYGSSQLAVIALPVPLNADCNNHLKRTAGHHLEACVLARLALAVWRNSPDRHQEFHDWLFETETARTAKEARGHAISLIGERALKDELAHGAVDEQIEMNVDLFGRCGTGKMPKLLFHQVVNHGALNSKEELFALLEKEFPIQIQAQQSRMISVLDGGAELDAKALPILGSPDADYVLVELFDYTCPGCKEMHRFLSTAQKRYGPSQLAIITLPVPLNAGCNGHVKHTARDHRDACVLAKLALAVWRQSPEHFEHFHHWLFESEKARTAKESRHQAISLIGEQSLNDELVHWAIDEQIGINVDLYDRCGVGTIPKLLFRQFINHGRPESEEELFELLKKELGIEPATPDALAETGD